VSGTENSMQELFERAASLLLGNEVDAAGDHDARLILHALEYASESSNRIDSETANRAHLLIAASRFARVFELASADAPGLFSFGAQFDPALADSLHDGSPMVGVSGVGLTLRDAFQGCIGEGIEYLSQLQAGTDLLLKAGVDDRAGKLGPMALELVAAVSERRMQPEWVLSWCRTTRLADPESDSPETTVGSTAPDSREGPDVSDPKRVQDTLHYELGKLTILNADKTQEAKDQAKKLYGQAGVDAMDKPLALEAPQYDRTKVQTRDPILDGLKGLASEAFVAWKDSPKRQRLVQIGAFANNLVDEIDKSTGLNKYPNGWYNKVNEVMDAGINATGAPGAVPARPLRPNEVAELKKIYGNSLDTSKIQLRIGYSGQLTKDDRPVAIADSNGRTTIHYPRGGRYSDPPPMESLVHETLHAWQRQHGSARYMADSAHDQLAKGTGEAYNWRRAVGQGLVWSKWGTEQQAKFIQEAYEHGTLLNPDKPWVIDGQDLRGHVRDALKEIRAGRGAP